MSIVTILPGKATEKLHTRDALVEEHIHLVAHVARRLSPRLPPSFDLTDLISAGHEALLKAAASFDPEEYPDVPFAAYARMKIRGGIIDTVRRKNYMPNVLPSIDDVPEHLTARDNVVEMEIDAGRLRRRVRDAVAELPEAERKLVTRLYLESEEYSQPIAGRLRTSCRAKRELHSQALDRLRNLLAA